MAELSAFLREITGLLKKTMNGKNAEQASIVIDGKKVEMHRSSFTPLAPKHTKGFRTCFIDGGSADVVASPSCCVGIVRRAVLVYDGEESKSRKVEGFYCFCQLVGEEIIVRTDTPQGFIAGIGLRAGDTGGGNSPASAALGIIRRLYEMDAATEIIKKKGADMVILDGSLQCETAAEKSALSALREACEKNDVLLLGLSKSTNAHTLSGLPSHVALSSLGGTHAWYCRAYSGIGVDSGFARLTAGAKGKGRVCRIDSLEIQRGALHGALLEAAFFCSDAIFIGYPYGLIAADADARVSNQEALAFRSELAARMGNDFDLFEEAERSLDGHVILDKLQF